MRSLRRSCCRLSSRSRRRRQRSSSGKTRAIARHGAKLSRRALSSPALRGPPITHTFAVSLALATISRTEVNSSPPSKRWAASSSGSVSWAFAAARRRHPSRETSPRSCQPTHDPWSSCQRRSAPQAQASAQVLRSWQAAWNLSTLPRKHRGRFHRHPPVREPHFLHFCSPECAECIGDRCN